ncbi:MAG: hypothetical protein K1X28_03510 [Parachlamydiales bacterium]|nr:hypothetical protein [Parachlamydiales bacterium]
MTPISTNEKITYFLEAAQEIESQKVFARDIDGMAYLQGSLSALQRRHSQLLVEEHSEDECRQMQEKMASVAQKVKEIIDISYAELCDGSVTARKKRDIDLLVNASDAVSRLFKLAQGPIPALYLRAVIRLCNQTMEKINDETIVPKAYEYLSNTYEKVRFYTIP